MSRFGGLIYQRFIMPNQTLILITLFAVLVGVIAYYSFMKWGSIKNEQKTTDMPLGGNLTIYFFHVDWCPHCKTAAPEWNAFKDEYNDKTVKGFKITCVDMDCTDDSSPEIKALMDKYKIESFPTVKGVLENEGKSKIMSYEAKVNKKNLEKFVNTIT
jgi:thiol-disulfide isomerase/thioredoxin